MKTNENNMKPQPKWQGLAPDINKTTNQAQQIIKHQKHKIEKNTMTQSPWFPRKAQLDSSSIFHGNFSCNETPCIILP